MSEIKAAFLGPHSENIDLLENLLLEVLRDHAYWRRNFHPEDSQIITQSDKQSASYQDAVAKLKQELFSILSDLKRGVPFYSLRYLGHINSDLLLSSIVAYFGAMLYNQNNVVAESSPVTVRKEMEYIAALAKMVGLPRMDLELLKSNPGESSWGHLCSGGTTANIEAIWAARNARFYPLSIALTLKKLETKYLELANLEITNANSKICKLNELSAFQLLSLPPKEALDLRVQLKEQLLHSRGEKDGSEAIKNIERSFFGLQKLGFLSFLKECELEGLAFQPPVVVVPKSVHYSWPKTVDVLGLGRNALIEIDLDDSFRMSVDHLSSVLIDCCAKEIPILAVIGICGTTEEGAIDPLQDINSIRQTLQKGKNISYWIHSDAAYGGFFAAMLRSDTRDASKTDHQYAGIDALKYADSITIDPHKLGYVPYPAGAILFRDSRVREHITFNAPYLNDNEDVSKAFLGKWTLEGSRPGAAAVSCYIAQHCFPMNDQGYGAILQDCIKATYHLTNAFDAINSNHARNKGFKVARLYEPELNIVCYNVSSAKYVRDPDFLNNVTNRIFNRLTITGDHHVNHYDYIVSKTGYSKEKYGRQINGYLRTLGINPPSNKNYQLEVLRTVVMHPLAKDSIELFDHFADYLCTTAWEVLPGVQMDFLKERFKNRCESRRMKILIVEDAKEERDTLKYLLEMELEVGKALEIKNASTKEEAIKLFSVYEPDAMVIDLNLTGTLGEFKGISLIEEVKKKDFNSVVSYSSYTDSAYPDSRGIEIALKELGLRDECIISKNRLGTEAELTENRRNESISILNALISLI